MSSAWLKSGLRGLRGPFSYLFGGHDTSFWYSGFNSLDVCNVNSGSERPDSLDASFGTEKANGVRWFREQRDKAALLDAKLIEQTK
eukprot:1381233-Rhodomonas_salina.2